MIAMLKAFRDALVADATLTALVPAANIYAGLRDEKTPLPAVDIFRIASGEPEKYAGANVGGMMKVDDVFQISVFATNEVDGWHIADQVIAIVLGDNTILNAAKIKNTSLINMPSSMRESSISHIPIRIRCNYHLAIT